MTNNEPPSDAPKIMEVLEAGINFFNRELCFDADDFAQRVLTSDAVQSVNLLSGSIKYQYSKRELV